MQRIFILLWLMCLPLTLLAEEPANLINLRVQPSLTVSHFYFTLTKKAYGRIKYIPSRHQVIIEFENTDQHFTLKAAKLSGSNVESITAENKSGGVTKFILTLKNPVKWSIHYFPANIQGNVLLQIDILTVNPKAPSKPNPLQEKMKDSFRNEILNSFSELSKQSKSKMTEDDGDWIGRSRLERQKPAIKKPHVFVVVIDPGHGGKDSGARGLHGVEEKNVVLAIAKRLAQEINHSPNMRAVLTRHGDDYLSLRERLKFARKANADLFVAVHADAYFDASARGASVYALSQRGATSEAARWLAQRENYSELDGVELNSLKDHSPMLRSVLIDMAQTATIQDSLRLGNKVLDALDDISSLHYKHVEQAPFVVLKSPDIPSILVETGFISNPKEEQRLSDPSYQTKVAHALWRAIHEYAGKS